MRRITMIISSMALVFFIANPSISATGQIVQEFQVPAEIHDVYDGGVEWDGEYLWLPCRNSNLGARQVDSVTGQLTGKSLPNTSYSVPGVAYDSTNGILYNLAYPCGPIYGVNVDTGQTVKQFAVPECWLHDIAFDGEYVWATKDNGTVYQFDPNTEQHVGSFVGPGGITDPYGNGPNLTGVTYDGNYFWFTRGVQGTDVRRFYKVDPEIALLDGHSDNAIVDYFDLDIGGEFASDGRYLWTWYYDAENQTKIIVKIDINPPLASAGPDQNVNEGSTVTLDGSSSADTDDGIASYLWTQTGGPSVTLSDTTVAQPTFTAPDVDADGASLNFKLTVADYGGLQSEDACIVNITGENGPPLANAGPNQTVNERSTVALDGSNSSDSDGTIASYLWTQTGGPSVTLSDATAAQPTFTAPDVDVYGTSFTFQLTVMDSGGLQSTDTCTVTVENTDIQPTCTSQPSKPQLLSPAEGETDVSPTPTLSSSSFVDPSWCSTHWKTRWQISEQSDFSGLTLNANIIDKDLTSYQVDRLVLEPNTTYYWRVRYWGTNGNKTDWSDVFSFTTQADSSDGNDNGIPNNQEVDDSVDLNEDGTLDNNQTNELKSIKTAKGKSEVCIHPQDSQITVAEAVDDDSTSDYGDKPTQVPRGLIAFRLTVPYQGYRARVKIHLSEPAPQNAKWVLYDEVNGWVDYSDHASFNNDRDEVIVELKDGGYGDSDHTANGFIVDPSGLGIYEASATGMSIVDDSGGGGGCFISTLW